VSRNADSWSVREKGRPLVRCGKEQGEIGNNFRPEDFMIERIQHFNNDHNKNLDKAIHDSAQDLAGAADRFAEEQVFEEDVRAMLSMFRPNRRERLLGWSEYRSTGAQFRATISWDPALEKTPADSRVEQCLDAQLTVPRLIDILESILVGSVKNQDELHAAEEFEIYRRVVQELRRRIDQMQSCYE
jgi:hypothetical protein